MTLAREIVDAIADDPKALRALAAALKTLQPPPRRNDLKTAAARFGLSEAELRTRIPR
jgi:hypothetical protein